jgi:drug/metabolite transporter (DMT)-like permease
MSLLAKIPPAADAHSARLAGIGLMLLSVFMFSFGDALGKFMVATYSVGQLLLLRACAALIALSPMIWRHRAAFQRLERPRLLTLFAAAGCISVSAPMCVNRSLKLAPASVVAPYQYSMIIRAVMFGLAVFGDVPSPATIIGAAIIIAAGFYIFRAGA